MMRKLVWRDLPVRSYISIVPFTSSLSDFANLMSFQVLRFWIPICLLFLSTGCVNRWNTRLPTCFTRPAEFERREAQVQDPYPDDRLGPDVGFRPLGYQEPRSEPQKVKDQAYVSFLRQQNQQSGFSPQQFGAPVTPQYLPPSSQRPPAFPQGQPLMMIPPQYPY